MHSARTQPTLSAHARRVLMITYVSLLSASVVWLPLKVRILPPTSDTDIQYRVALRDPYVPAMRNNTIVKTR